MEEATQVGGSMWRRQQRSGGLCGEDIRDREVGVEKAAEVLVIIMQSRINGGAGWRYLGWRQGGGCSGGCNRGNSGILRMTIVAMAAGSKPGGKRLYKYSVHHQNFFSHIYAEQFVKDIGGKMNHAKTF